MGIKIRSNVGFGLPKLATSSRIKHKVINSTPLRSNIKKIKKYI